MFFLAAVLVAPAFAQYDRDEEQNKRVENDRDIVFTDHPNNRDFGRDNDRNSFSKRELDYKIARVNREYDYKIRTVQNNYFMNRFKKERIIRSLEEQRRDEIKQLYRKFNYRKNRYDDHYPRRNW